VFVESIERDIEVSEPGIDESGEVSAESDTIRGDP
jgi:hypothetical protein